MIELHIAHVRLKQISNVFRNELVAEGSMKKVYTLGKGGATFTVFVDIFSDFVKHNLNVLKLLYVTQCKMWRLHMTLCYHYDNMPIQHAVIFKAIKIDKFQFSVDFLFHFCSKHRSWVHDRTT